MRNPLGALFQGSPERQRVAWMLVVGLLVALLALAGGGRKFVESYEGMTSPDRVTRISAYLSGAETHAIPVTLIAIDDDTRSAWHITTITPHDKLAGLVKVARDNQAAAILLDIDLSSDSPAPIFSEELGDEIAAAAKVGPPLMLVRSIVFRREIDANGSPRFIADSARPTPYDNMVGDAGKVVWVSAIPVFTADRVVRKMRLWQVVCNDTGDQIYPSPALYVAALADGWLDDLARLLDDRKAADCRRRTNEPSPARGRQSRDAFLQFIIGADENDARGRITRSDGGKVDLFRQRSARQLLKGDQMIAAEGATGADFKDRVVVIGVTHADSRDVYATPLGSQSGAMILANTVADARAMAETEEFPVYAERIIVVALFALFILVGTSLQLTIATIVIGLLAILFVMVTARHIGFDPAIRIVAVALTSYVLFHITISLVGIALAWKGGLGWRAILAKKTGH